VRVTSRGIWNVIFENTRNRRWHWDSSSPPQESPRTKDVRTVTSWPNFQRAFQWICAITFFLVHAKWVSNWALLLSPLPGSFSTWVTRAFTPPWSNSISTTPSATFFFRRETIYRRKFCKKVCDGVCESKALTYRTQLLSTARGSSGTIESATHTKVEVPNLKPQGP